MNWHHQVIVKGHLCFNMKYRQQWRGESKAAGGGSPINGAPPQSYFFCLLVCHVVGTTCNDLRSLRNTFGWMGALQAPQQFHGRVKLQRICILRYLNLDLILLNNTQMIMHFFSCELQYKVKGKSQRSKIFNSQVSYQKKMCMFYSSKVRFKNLWTNFSNCCRLINIGRILFILISLESV